MRDLHLEMESHPTSSPGPPSPECINLVIPLGIHFWEGRYGCVLRGEQFKLGCKKEFITLPSYSPLSLAINSLIWFWVTTTQIGHLWKAWGAVGAGLAPTRGGPGCGAELELARPEPLLALVESGEQMRRQGQLWLLGFDLRI